MENREIASFICLYLFYLFLFALINSMKGNGNHRHNLGDGCYYSLIVHYHLIGDF